MERSTISMAILVLVCSCKAVKGGFYPTNVGGGQQFGGYGGYPNIGQSQIGYGGAGFGGGYGGQIATAGGSSGVGGINYRTVGVGRSLNYAPEIGAPGYSHVGGVVGPQAFGGQAYKQIEVFEPLPYGGNVGGLGYKGAGAGLGAGGIGYKGAGFGGAGLSSGGLGFGGYGGKFIGGESIEKGVYEDQKKNLNDEQYEKIHGKTGGASDRGEAGFTKGESALKDVKGESAYFSDVDGAKKVYQDGKSYHGTEHFDKEGKNEGEKSLKQGHKKGHKVKGFKSSHHKDETGKTEEFYDEDHDEGGNFAFDGHSGHFGEGSASSFKGGHEDGKFNSGEVKKEGHFDNEYLADKTHANHGKFGENKYAGKESVFGATKGIDETGLSGQSESSKYFKHVPIHY